MVVDPAYKGQEGDEVWNIGGLYKWDRSYLANTRMDDQRFGRRLGFYNDIGLNAAGENIIVLHVSDPAGGTAHQVALNLGFLSIASGQIAYGQETDLKGRLTTVVCGTLSICQAQHTLFDATKGEGDSGGDYLEFNCWGGAFNGDDEGCKGRSTALYDGTVSGILPMGRVVGVGSNSLTMTVASLDGYTRSWGEGRYAVKVMSGGKDAVLLSAHAVSQRSPSQTAGPHGHGAFGTVAFAETVPVSTAWGQATAYFSLPPTNDTATAVSVTSTLDGPGAFVNGPACWEGGHRTGQGLISNAGPAQNGRQAFTISLYEDPDGGAKDGQFFPYFFQGGLCGTIARPAAFDNGIGKSNQALPFIGSTDAHTGVTGIHYHVGLGMVPGFNESVLPDGSLPELALYKFYSAARIVALKNPQASAGFLGSYIGLEPHSWKAAVGDLIESPTTYSTFLTISTNLMIARLPGDLRGHDEIIGDIGANGGFAHYHFANLNAANRYQGMGGNLAGAPSLFDVAGVYSGLANFHAPAPGAILVNVGCGPLGCADPTSYHTLYRSYGNGGIWEEQHIQNRNQVSKGFRNGETMTVTLGAGFQLATSSLPDGTKAPIDLVNAPIRRAAYVQTTAPAPTSGSAPCVANAMWHDDNFLYVCNAAGTASKRVALSSF